MTQDIRDVNEYAKNRFEELKKRFHLNQIVSVLPRDKQDQIRNEVTMKDSIDKVIKETEARLTYSSSISEEAKDKAEEKAQFVEDSFKFIESLNLPPQLSLAIGLIISGHKTDNLEDLNKAWCEIKNFTSDKWNEKYGKKEGTSKT